MTNWGGANGEVLVKGSFGEFYGVYGGFDFTGIEEAVCRQEVGQDIHVNDK